MGGPKQPPPSLNSFVGSQIHLPDSNQILTSSSLQQLRAAHMLPNTEGILESSQYVTDVAGSARFYEKIFGFQVRFPSSIGST
jgi:hypothetical protein